MRLEPGDRTNGCPKTGVDRGLLVMWTAGVRRDLDCFVVLAEELSFSRAAARVHVSQPALTQRIKALEQHLGVKLVARSNRSVRLTAPGMVLLEEVPAILGQLERSAKRVRDTAGSNVTIVRVGHEESAMHTVVVQTLVLAAASEPRARFQLRELTTEHQLTALAVGELDVGFGWRIAGDVRPSWEALWTEPVVACVSREHRFAGRPYLDVGDLDDEAILVMDHREPCLAQLSSALEARGVVPRIVQEASRYSTLVRLARAGLGVAIVAGSAPAAERDLDISIVPVLGLENQLCFTWWGEGAINNWMLALVRRAAQPWAQRLDSMRIRTLAANKVGWPISQVSQTAADSDPGPPRSIGIGLSSNN